MSTRTKKKKENKSKSNNLDVYEFYKKLDLDTEQKRNRFLNYSSNENTLNYTIGYSTTTGSPLTNA